MKRARHKRVVFHCITEHNNFGAAETFGRDFGRAFDGFACQLDRIHIDTGARAADIDGAAHDIGSLIVSGMERISTSSEGDMPFCTNAEKPPIKDTPMALAALSKVCATLT